jgi:hypothetical protein
LEPGAARPQEFRRLGREISAVPILRVAACTVLLLLVAPPPGPGLARANGLFHATPLVDFSPEERYLGKYQGFLYTDPATGRGTNQVPAAHDADGREIASRVVPLDPEGRPSPSGKIGVAAIGMSNWSMEWCRIMFRSADQCLPESFIARAREADGVNHHTLVLADCAYAGFGAHNWVDDRPPSSPYELCLTQRLPLWDITAKQVEVVLWEDADPIGPNRWPSMTPGMVCRLSRVTPFNQAPQGSPDVCTYEQYVGMIARFLKAVFPHVKQLFLHTRTYGGYATIRLNPEPYAYEEGFATKWLIDAQIAQMATGRIDPIAGDLNYRDGTAPWIVWGPYWWSAATDPCRYCAEPGLIWTPGDFDRADGTHPSPAGISKVAQMLLQYYLHSPYSPWFRE